MKPVHLVTIALITLIAVVQGLRLVLRWDVTVNGVAIPLWASAIALVVALSLAIALWRESRRLGTAS